MDEIFITCAECGASVHHMGTHLKDKHPEMTVAAYQAAYPEAALTSPTFEQKLQERQRQKARAEAATSKMASKLIPFSPAGTIYKQRMHELFNLPLNEATQNAAGQPVQVDVRTNVRPEDEWLIPEIDPGYVFSISELKDVLAGFQLNIPVYVWGMHGAGKTSLLEQICHYTHRPFMRVQHTAMTEESHILGQWTVRDGSTVWEPGPLQLAMLHGWTYCGDEYDVAQPGVVAVYQAVLEGKTLVTKEAPPEYRHIKPHPHFRFCATGNTNGAGDDTGLYQGTTVQNSAAYSRFGITINVKYPPKDQEEKILVQQIGVSDSAAKSLVDLADRIRIMYSQQELSVPISPRELLNAAKLGLIYGCKWSKGLDLAFVNRLQDAEAVAVRGAAQRIFG